ncbi:MAG: EAL domain-containing protein [Kyrpidia sp.]|nr:EAL domain-containing protein [Kyrpidia sp.]
MGKPGETPALEFHREFRQEVQTILAIICRLTRAKGGWITLLAPDGTFSPAAAVDLPDVLARDDCSGLRSGLCCCQRQLLEGRLSSTVNYLVCERLEELEGQEANTRIHASVPLVVCGEPAGVMNLLLPRDQFFSESDLELATMVGRALETVLMRQFQYASVESRKMEAEYQLAVLLNEFPGLVMFCEPSGRISFINDIGKQYLGFHKLEDIQRYRIFDDVPVLLDLFSTEAAGTGERVWKGEAVLHSLAGDRVQVLLTAFSPSAHVKSRSFVVIATDISERKRLEERLRQLADYDSLTGVYNRRRFQEELARVLTGTDRGTLLFVDFDNFKAINDNLGHRAGDELLNALIGSLREVVDGRGFVGRLGGDEFALFVPGATVEQARVLGEAIERAFRRHRVFLDGRRVIMTASIGIAEYPSSGSTVEQLLAHADTAMYTAKRTGAHVHVYDPFQREETATTQELLWATRIREALEKDGLVLYAQPILDLHLRTVTRYELLLRMRGDNEELISPKAFLGVAEKTDLIHRIDIWVAREAIRLLDRIRSYRPGVCFHVNLSARVFSDRLFPNLLAEELSRTNVDPSQLLFEITETAAIEDYARARSFVHTVRNMGFRFALDDFGIGFSSLYSLKYLPLDYLKIDGVFIQDLARNRVDQSLVKGLTVSMRELGIQTIAEFVEDEQTIDLLLEYGVNYAQGFHVGRPQPISDIVERTA